MENEIKLQNIQSMCEEKRLVDNELLMNSVSIILEENILSNFIITYNQTFSIGYIFLNIAKGISEINF